MHEVCAEHAGAKRGNAGSMEEKKGGHDEIAKTVQ